MQIKKEDRRVQRTRKLLFDTLIALMIEKGYEAITVQDIIDRANIGRSTFYSHFYDKEQLLIANIEQLRIHLTEQVTNQPSTMAKAEYRFGFSKAMFEHVQNHKSLYRAVVGVQSGALVMHRIRKMLVDMAAQEIDGNLSKLNLQIPSEVIIEFVVTTFYTILTWWMDQENSMGAEECDLLFHKLVFSGILEPSLE